MLNSYLNMTENPENCECRYFISYSGVKLPLKLVTPLTEAELQNRNTFFRGYFDAQERLLLCQKMVYADIELQHRYQYYPNGILKDSWFAHFDTQFS